MSNGLKVPVAQEAFAETDWFGHRLLHYPERSTAHDEAQLSVRETPERTGKKEKESREGTEKDILC
jgi:hypothetical protein